MLNNEKVKSDFNSLRFRITLSQVHTLSFTRANLPLTLSVRPLEVSHFPHALPNGLQLLHNPKNNRSFCTSIMQLNNVTIQSSEVNKLYFLNSIK